MSATRVITSTSPQQPSDVVLEAPALTAPEVAAAVLRGRGAQKAWSENAMARAVIAIAGADADIKGAAADPKYALERAIMTVCAARGSK